MTVHQDHPHRKGDMMFIAFGRIVTALAAMIACVAMTANPSAADPMGQCPRPFHLAPADFSPVSTEVDLKGNNDGWVCHLTFEHGPGAGFNNVTDNRIPLHATPSA